MKDKGKQQSLVRKHKALALPTATTDMLTK